LGWFGWLVLVPACVAALSAAAAATSASAIATTAVATASAASAAFSAAATTTSSIAATTAAAAVATTASATFVAGACFVDAQGAPVDLFAIELAHSVLRIGVGSHGHEGESAGFAREFILHEEDFCDGTGCRKHILQLEFRCSERQVAYVQSISHNGIGFSLFRMTGLLLRGNLAENDSNERSC
jgi:hypothetical protein